MRSLIFNSKLLICNVDVVLREFYVSISAFPKYHWLLLCLIRIDLCNVVVNYIRGWHLALDIYHSYFQDFGLCLWMNSWRLNLLWFHFSSTISVLKSWKLNASWFLSNKACLILTCFKVLLLWFLSIFYWLCILLILLPSFILFFLCLEVISIDLNSLLLNCHLLHRYIVLFKKGVFFFWRDMLNWELII